MTTPEAPGPLLTDGMVGLDFPSEAGVALEAAIEAVNGVVGAYNGLIAAEESRPAPDTGAISAWIGEVRACIRHRKALRLGATATIADTRRRFAGRLAGFDHERSTATLDEADTVLPPDENRRIFRERIVPDEIGSPVPQERPTAVFVVGQPGAGKTALGNALADRLDRRGGFVDVDSDLYKPFHPRYRELLARDDKLMAALTGADGRAWMGQVQQHVRDRRLLALVQETAQNPAYLVATFAAYREAGFGIELVVMGVPEALSNQGILNRYHEQVRDRGQGRLTVPAKADLSYAGIVELAGLVDEDGLVDHVKVFRRGENEPRHRNTLDGPGRWRDRPRLRAAVEAERAAPMTTTERADFEAVQAKLRHEMGPEWAPQLDRIERLGRAHRARPTR